MIAVEQLAQEVGTSKACDALAVSRATVYRQRHRQANPVVVAPRSSSRALAESEREQVRQTLYSERFMDKSPYQVYATLLDEGEYLCSVRTMYRILSDEGANKERRNQLKRPNYIKPELLATSPNQVWSWDITKLKGPEKWTYYYLYVILDIFSRYVVGWMLAHREQAELASKLIRETVKKQDVREDELIIHSDRGPSMTSHSVSQLLVSLGVTKSHSRPHVSNDNPFSESQFKTMKYQPDFPTRFGCYEDGLSSLPTLLRLVQRPALPQRHWLGHTFVVALRPSGAGGDVASSNFGSGLREASRSFRAWPSETTATTVCSLDQSTNKKGRKRKEKASGDQLSPEAQRSVFDAPSTRLSLGELRPRRARFRFAGQLENTQYANPSQPLNTRVMPEKIPGVWGLAPIMQQSIH